MSKWTEDSEETLIRVIRIIRNNMKTKFYTLLLALAAMAVSTSALQAQQYDFQEGQLFYKITDAAKKTVSVVPENSTSPYYTTNPAGGITIPASVTYDGISYSVTSIGDRVFYNCTCLTSFTIPAAVTSIGDYAFYYCSGLTSINIPDGVTIIGQQAFYHCSSLTSITIPSSVTSIDERTFDECSGLTAFAVDSENTKYSSADGVLFNKDKSILFRFPPKKQTVEYIIPASVKRFGWGAFYGSTGLTSVSIPNSVTSIGERAFNECSGLTSVTIPASVTHIGDLVFYKCTGLTTITVDSENTKYSSEDGVLFNKDKTTLMVFPNANPITDYTIPSSVVSIEDNAFNECSGLSSVIIPSSVTSIDNNAFSYCSGLTEINCHIADPASITPFGWNVFKNVPKTIPLYVPVGSKEKYAVADQWKDFTNIVEKVFTGVSASLAEQGIQVRGGKGIIEIQAPQPPKGGAVERLINVYGLSGALLHTSLLPADFAGSITLTPPSGGWRAGVYIVRIGKDAEKVVVHP